jgi:hypothetical protein
MKRTVMLQGVRRMKFESVLDRWERRQLSQAEAAEVLGMSERTFRRCRDRYDHEGLEGLYDRRLGKASANRCTCGGRLTVKAWFWMSWFRSTGTSGPP